MIRQDLVTYIKQYSAQGYNTAALKDSLLQQGFPAQDVEDSLQAAIKKQIPLIKIGFILGAVIIVLLLVVFLMSLGGEEESEDASKRVEAPVTPPLVIIEPEEIPELVSVEPQVSPTPSVPEPEVSADDLICPGVCNDYNICTRDLCSQGQCLFQEIKPCCGNQQCEFGESEDSCPDDCAREQFTQEQSFDAIASQAEQMTASNLPKAIQLCQSLVRTSDSDNCLKNVASTAQNVNVCGSVYSTKKKDECYMNHAIEQEDFTTCASISDRWLKNSCVQYGKLRTAQLPQAAS